MKKGLKLLLTLLLAFSIGVGSALADDYDEGDEFNKTYDEGKPIKAAGVTINGRTLELYQHSFTDANGNTINGYCLDAQFSGGKQNTTYQVARILGTDGYGQGVNMFDQAELNMLKYSLGTEQLKDANGNPINLTNDQLFAAITIAHRAFATGFYNYGTNPDDSSAGFYGAMKTNHAKKAMEESMAYVNLGAQLAAKYSDEAGAVMGSMYNCSNYSDPNCYKDKLAQQYTWYDPSKTNNSFSGMDGTIMQAVDALFKAGLDAAYKYGQTGTTGEPTLSVSLNGEAEDGGKDGDIQTSYTYGTINFENFDANKGTFGNFNLNCPECSKNGMTAKLEYKDANGNWVELTPDMDVTKLFNSKDGLVSGSLEIRVASDADTGSDQCGDANFGITYDFNNGLGKETYGGIVLNSNTAGARQRFTAIDRVGDTSKPGKGNNDGKLSCTHKDKEKKPCETHSRITEPDCESGEPGEVYAPTDIKACLIDFDAKDEAGNTYQSMLNSVQNKYCAIFCKEDYNETLKEGKIKLQKEITDVVCGGYFSLTSEIKGTKDCYVGNPEDKTHDTGDPKDKSIDKDTYLDDIWELQELMADAKNRYNRFSALLTSVPTRSETTHSCCDGSTATHHHIDMSEVEYIRYDLDWFDPDESQSTPEPKNVKEKPGPYDDNCECKSSCACTYTDKNGTHCAGDGGAYCDNNAEESLQKDQQYWTAEKARAESDLIIFKQQYEATIQMYNSCTTLWTTVFPFEQKLKYEYNENYYDQWGAPYTNLMDRNGLRDQYGYLEVNEEKEKIDRGEIEVCLDGVSDEYECGGGLLFDIEIDSGGVGFWNENLAYGSTFEDRTYTVCTKDECIAKSDHPISQALFIKKSREKKLEYISPTAFYQIEMNGRVGIIAGYDGNGKVRTDNELENRLPVSDSVVGGGVFKIQIEDLGEYYDTGELGRIMDYGDNRSNILAEALGAFDGNYECHYYANCNSEKCPTCKFNCKKGKCNWDECPDCTPKCVNCIWNFGDLLLVAKTIDTVTFTSANRTYGFNWITGITTGQLSLLSQKATTTIYGGFGDEGIEANNTTIYNDDISKVGTSAGLAFSIRMNRNVIEKAREYNRRVENLGGYANDSLTCKDANVDGQTYKSIYCYSDFIDELINTNSNAFPESMSTILSNRANPETYWELWPGYSSIAAQNEACFKDDPNNFSCITYGGPSWK